MKKWLVCVAITCNAICAGGVYSFPLISPALVQHMHFSQPQLTTIALAGMVGQYPFAALIGKVLDRHGPRTCSLAASLSFALGFSLFSFEISHAPDNTPSPSMLAFFKLSFSFALVGLATVFSYFSIVFSATSTFPAYTGVASGTTMALFGSSPLLLAALAAHFFTDPDPAIGLNVTRFLACLAIITGVTHAFGAVCLPGPVVHVHVKDQDERQRADGNLGSSGSGGDRSHDEEDPDADEHSPLIIHRAHPYPTPSSTDDEDNIGKCTAVPTREVAVHTHLVPVREPQHGTILDLLRDRHFWILVLVVMILVGECEMIMANLGSLFLSLPPISSFASGASLSSQIQVLSLANTLSRLGVGPLADILAPSPTILILSRSSAAVTGSNGASSSTAHRTIWAFPRRHHLSRTWFLGCAVVVLALTFGWALVKMRTQDDVWVLCIGVGVVYGAVFTVLPGLLSSIYGPPNLGRNFGVLSYAFFIGTSTWAYLYAAVAEAHTSPAPPLSFAPLRTDSAEMCVGTLCWAPTFGVALGALAVAMIGAGVLWRAWRERV